MRKEAVISNSDRDASSLLPDELLNTRIDALDEAARSAHMSKIKGKGNKSTEAVVETALLQANITGWVKHPKEIVGKPDFFFPDSKIALFVDGCFWHGCPRCKRRVPSNRSDFWRKKIDDNRRRDNRQHRRLREQGYHVMRVWEHQLKKITWLKRLQAMLRRLDQQESMKQTVPC